MSFYSELAGTADELIKEFGAIGQLRYAPKGDYDPDAGAVVEPTPTLIDVKAVVFDYDDFLINGSLIQVGDKQVFVSAVGVSLDPDVTGEFIWEGKTYKVIKVKPLAPATIDVLYELQVRA